MTVRNHEKAVRLSKLISRIDERLYGIAERIGDTDSSFDNAAQLARCGTDIATFRAVIEAHQFWYSTERPPT